MTDTHNPEEWLSVTEAAEVLTALGDKVTRSPLSRYIQSHEIPNRKEGRTTLVHFPTLKEHRIGKVEEVKPQQVESLPRQIETPAPISASIESLTDKQRKEKLAADLAEFKLAEYRGQLVDVAAVESAIATAASLFEQIFDSQVVARAEEFAVQTDEVALKAQLKAVGRKLRESLATSLAQVADLEKVAA